MTHIGHRVIAKVLLGVIGALLLVLVSISAIRLRSERATFERCRHHHLEVAEKLDQLRALSRFSPVPGYEDAWNEGCEIIHISFGTSWGHFPSRTSESAYKSLSADLDTILQSESVPSVILEQVWVRIGKSSPHILQSMQEKEHAFRETLARLKKMADGATKDGAKNEKWSGL